MNDELSNPENLNALAKKIHARGELDKANAIFGFGIGGEIIASAVCFLYKKPSLSMEIIERNELRRFPDEITLLLVAHGLDKADELIEIIKQFRKRGIKIERLIATAKISPDIEDELRVIGIDTCQV